MNKKSVRRKLILLLLIFGIGYLVYTGQINPSAWWQQAENQMSKGTTSGPFGKELNEAVNRKYGHEQNSDVQP